MRATIVKAVFGCLAAAGLGSLAAIAACANSAEDCELIGTCVSDAGEEGGQVGTDGGTDGGAPPVYSLCDSKRYGDVQEQAARGIVVDAKTGNTFVSGSFAGALNLSPSSTLSATTAEDLFVAKFNPDLALIWAYSRPVKYLDSAYDPATGGVTVVGTKSDAVDLGCGLLDATPGFFLLRLDGSGACKASRALGMSPTAVRVAVDSTGNVALAGTFSDSMDVGGSTKLVSTGGTDIFIARYDSTLNHVWSGAIGTLGDDAVGGVDFDSSGDVVLAGTFNGSLELAGSNPIASKGADVLLARLGSENGAVLAHKKFVTPGDQVVFDIAVGPSNRVTLAGSMLGGGTLFDTMVLPVANGIFLARLEADYKPVFSKGYAFQGTAGLAGLAVEPGGKVALAGLLNGTIDVGGGSLKSEGEDAFVAAFDAEGAHVLSQRFGDAAAQVALGVAFSGDDVLLGGAFAGKFGALESNGGADIFVARLCPQSP